MKKRHSNDFEERQRQCMCALIRDILSDKSVTQITYENRHGSISVSREIPEMNSVHAIGFTADFDDYDDSDDEEE